MLPPDAAARDAAKRSDEASAIEGDEFRFVTRGVSDEEKAAVIAILTQAHTEEMQRVRRV